MSADAARAAGALPSDAAAAADRPFETAFAKLDKFARGVNGSDLWVWTGDALTGAEAAALVAGFRAAVERAENAERETVKWERAVESWRVNYQDNDAARNDALDVAFKAEQRALSAERRLTELQTAVKEVASGDWDRDYILIALRAALAGSAVEENTQDEAPASGRGEEA